MKNTRKLVLIDIDGTMLSPGLTPRRALSQAIGELTGAQFEFQVSQLAGFTDPLIVQNALAKLGWSEERQNGMPSRIIRRYVELLQERYPEAEDKRMWPGVPELLAFLAEHQARLGIITGNVQQGARIKLAPFGLWEHFSFGVFGDDSADRNQLPRLALQKVAARFGENYTPSDVIVIGDTLQDVRCAHVNGMRCCIVLRRPEWRAEITAAQPELLLESFAPLTPLQNWLMSLP